MLEQFPELRKASTDYHQFTIKEYSSGVAKCKECIGQVMEERDRASRPSLGPAPTQHLYTFTNAEVLGAPLFKKGRVMEVPICRDDW